MIVLGIETSCDETSAAVVAGGKLISNITAVQLFHAKYGGVVPELASRAHEKHIIPVVDEALRKASVKKNELNGISAVQGPGLIGSILVGLSFGKAMAMALNIPFIGINHMEAHIFSNMIQDPKPSFPFINLTISGGHTQLVLVKDFFKYEILGETIDDAAGEAFDKVAKMLGLEYPGGPMIDKLAKNGNPEAVNFPRPYLDSESLQFSFSGLKTSVLYYLRKVGFNKEKSDDRFVADVCASFQSAIVDVLVHKLIYSAKKFGVSTITISGGVSANSELRNRLKTEAAKNNLQLFIPSFEFCTDNGAMVAIVGYTKLKHNIHSSLEVTAEPNLQLNEG